MAGGRTIGWLQVLAALATLAADPRAAAQDTPPKAIPRAVPVAEPAAEPATATARPAPPDPAAPQAPREQRSVSRSGQFIVHGSGPLERGTVAVMAEDLKADLLRLLAAEDGWKSPVVVELHDDPRPRRSVESQLFVIGNQFRLQLDVFLARGIDHERFDHAVLAMLAYEWTLRGRPGHEVAGQRLQVRPWLVEGLREAVRWRNQRSDRRLYAAMFASGGLFKLDDLLAAGERDFDKLDGAARAAFKVSAGALALALLEQPDGRAAFRALLAEVAVFDGETPLLLRKHFPDLNLSEQSLAKWWALQIANMSEPALTEALSVPETEAALATALRLHVPGPDGLAAEVGLDQTDGFADLPEADRIAAVRPAQDALVRLSYRCFPSFRPLLEDYQKLLQQLVEGRPKGVAERLAELQSMRRTMVARAADGRDFLDWFEITRAEETSGEFDEYLRMKEDLRRKRPGGNDPVSLYLDRLQQSFAREGARPPAAQPPGDLPNLPALPAMPAEP